MDGNIIISDTFNPAYNLALEEYLIETNKNILYLWQNNDTIVIGRNQNPYKECDINKIKSDNINLMRRRSGGGAVFHDLGNLNFTLISKKRKNNIEENFYIVNRALSYVGIESIFNGRNDLHVEDKKISGNAFFEDGDIFCHHGTLLIDVDMNKLGTYLTASKLKLESKGIKSVKSRVVNLIDINPDINVDDVKKALIKSYIKEYNCSEVEYFSEDRIDKNKNILKKVNRYKSWDWIYGESPNSNIIIEEKFDWGIIEINLEIDSGMIKDICIYTDSIINDNFKQLSKKLKGSKLKRNEIVYSIEKNLENKQIINDLKNLEELNNI